MRIKRSISLIFLIVLGKCAVQVKECGIRKSSGRIVGGRDSGGYHYPWFALLVSKENVDFPVCAGSLITTRHILTAAHCFAMKTSIPRELLFDVLMGVYDRCDHGESTRKIFGVLHVAVHEEYDRNEKFHDIALVTLEKSADFTAVCLPPPDAGDATEPALLIGFGVTKQGGNKAPCRMVEAQIKKYSKRECANTDLPREDIEEPSVICAGVFGGGVDSCQGDSGGPLLTVTSTGRYLLTGIVSYGYGCANPGFPGLYTNVGAYIRWIENKVYGENPFEIRGSDRNFNDSTALAGNEGKKNSPGSGVTFPEDHRESWRDEIPRGRIYGTSKTRSARGEWGKFLKLESLPSQTGRDSGNVTEGRSIQNSDRKLSTVKFPANR